MHAMCIGTAVNGKTMRGVREKGCCSDWRRGSSHVAVVVVGVMRLRTDHPGVANCAILSLSLLPLYFFIASFSSAWRGESGSAFGAGSFMHIDILNTTFTMYVNVACTHK